MSTPVKTKIRVLKFCYTYQPEDMVVVSPPPPDPFGVLTFSHAPGEVLEIDERQARTLIARGLAEEVR